MWLNFLSKIRNNGLEKESNESIFIDSFVELFDIKIVDKEVFLDNWTVNGGGLFKESSALEEEFNSGNISYVISFFKYIKDLNQSVWDKKEINNMFSDDSTGFLCKKIFFDPVVLLSENKKERDLTFLFLYFYPKFYKNWLLFHPTEKTPLVTSPKITYNYFLMLLDLMKEYSREEFDIFSKQKNLCHLLIESWVKNNLYIMDFEEIKDLNCQVLKDKINIFLKHEFSIANLDSFLSTEDKKIFKPIITSLNTIEVKYKRDVLSEIIGNKKPTKELLVKI